METVELLKQLIQIPSVSGHEEKIGQFVFDSLVGLGLKPQFIGGSVVAKIAGKNEKNALIFNAHLDTVSAGDENQWQYPPFSGTIVGGRLYGLGASDEKAAVTTQILLGERLALAKPACDVWLTFVPMEEIDGLGTQNFVDWFTTYEFSKYKRAAAVLGEPTVLKSIAIAHKGNIFVKLTVLGDTGHGSRPDLIKKHSITQMQKIIAKMENLGKVWSKKYVHELLGAPTVGLTSISAGGVDCPNKFPDRCTATFDIRTVPGFHQKVLGLIKKNIKNIQIEVIGDPAVPVAVDKDEPIVRAAIACTHTPVKAFDGATDLSFLVPAKIPGIIFGPGEEDCIHSPNEFCVVKNIDKCVDLYLKIVDYYGS